MIKSFKTELDPNNKQKTLFAKHAGCARFAYNWALNLLQENNKKKKEEEKLYLKNRKSLNLPELSEQELKKYHIEQSKKYLRPNAIDLHKLINTKKESEFPWMYEVSKWSVQNALRQVETAYKNFFFSLKSKNKKTGLPKKKKKDQRDSFTLDNPIIVFENCIQLPKIGKVRLKEHNYLPLGKQSKATVSKRANRWFVSVSCEIPEIQKKELKQEKLGVDLGIKSLITCSDGTQIKNSDKLKKLQKTLKRTQRKLSKQKKGSKSRQKTKFKLQKLHYKISCSRNDIIHKTTTLLAKTKLEETIVMEDLNVKGMMKNHNLSQAIINVGMGEFKRQLLYKTQWYGKRLEFADRFFPSSKMCSKCGWINRNLKLSDRVFKCQECRLEIDRDLNAAINLKNYKENWKEELSTVRYTGIEAGGDKRFILSSLDEGRCLSKKPELNVNLVTCRFCKFLISARLWCFREMEGGSFKSLSTTRYVGINAGGDESFISLSLDEERCLSEKPEENISLLGNL